MPDEESVLLRGVLFFRSRSLSQILRFAQDDILCRFHALKAPFPIVDSPGPGWYTIRIRKGMKGAPAMLKYASRGPRRDPAQRLRGGGDEQRSERDPEKSRRGEGYGACEEQSEAKDL